MYLLFTLLLSLITFHHNLNASSEHKIETIRYNKHTYLLFDDKHLIHDPDCVHCVYKLDPQVIFKPKSPDLSKDETLFIMMPLDRSPFHKTYFPGLYYWMED